MEVESFGFGEAARREAAWEQTLEEAAMAAAGISVTISTFCFPPEVIPKEVRLFNWVGCVQTAFAAKPNPARLSVGIGEGVLIEVLGSSTRIAVTVVVVGGKMTVVTSLTMVKVTVVVGMVTERAY